MNKAYFYQLEKPGIKQYDVPESFNELDQNQLVEIMKIIHSQMPEHVARVKILAVLLRFNTRINLFKKLINGIKDGLDELLMLTDFTLEKPNLTISPFPFLKLNYIWKRPTILYGPTQDKILTYMVFLEWIRCEIYYRNYLKFTEDTSKKAEYLDKLIAVLYRAKGENHKGDYREPYNDYSVENRAKDLTRLDQGVKYAILYYFYTHREIWSQHFDHVYAAAEDASETLHQESTEKDLFKMMLSLAGNSKDMKILGETEASIVLLDLNNKIEESKKRPKHGS